MREKSYDFRFGTLDWRSVKESIPSTLPGARRRTAILSACVLFCVCSSHGWNKGHSKITQAAFGALPEWQRAHWQASEAGLRSSYCTYVDKGLENAEAKPYLVVVKGRLLHYFPRDNREDYAVFSEGAERYLRLVVGKMREGDYAEAAKFAGAFAHVIEDLAQPQCHALEGVNGLPWTTLDELFTPEDQSWNRAPQSIISLDDDSRFVVRLEGYRPQVLGTHEKEAAFRLYQRCCQLRRKARKALPSILACAYAGDMGGAVEASLPPAVEDAKVVADMFHTCFALAAGRFDPGEVKALETMDLTSLVPISAPALISVPYRFSPLAYNCSVTLKREPVPLQVWLPDEGGQKREVTLAKGIGTGCCRFSYEIPAGVFREFRCIAGLHSRLSLLPSGACLRLTVKVAGKVAFDSGVLEAGSLARKIAIPVDAGGTLELISEGRKGMVGNEANQTVWGEPVLVRLEAGENAARGTASGK